MPTKASITTRTAKGSPLTTAEMDGNLENLRDQSIGFSDDTSTVLNVDSGNTIAIAGGDSISTAISGTTLTVNLDESITVDSITAGDSTAISVQSPVIASSTIKFNGESTSVSSIKDEDNMASNSATALSTQQSIKAYADTKLANISEDTSPQLGGNLDVVTHSLVSTSNRNITVAPNGSGKLVVNNSKIEVFDDESAVDFTNYGGSTVLLQDSALGSNIGLTQAAVGPASGGNTSTYPDNIHYFIVNLDTSGTYSYADSSTVDGDIAYAFGYNFTDSRSELYAGGGALNITAYGTAADSYALKAIQLAGSQVNAQSELIFDKTYKETITTLTDDSTADIHIDCSATSVSTFSLNDNKTFVFTNLPTGRSHTLIITNQGSHTGTFQQADSTAVKFPGGAPTVTSGAGKIDVITVFNTGSEVIGNIAQDYS